MTRSDSEGLPMALHGKYAKKSFVLVSGKRSMGVRVGTLLVHKLSFTKGTRGRNYEPESDFSFTTKSIKRMQQKVAFILNVICTYDIVYVLSATLRICSASATHMGSRRDPDPKLIFSIRFTKPLHW